MVTAIPWRARYAAIAGGLLALASCSGGEPPNTALSQADLSVQRAVDAQAQTYAPVELNAAKTKLSDARLAVQKEDYDGPRRLAEDAESQADLATARANAAASRQTTQQLQQTQQQARQLQQPSGAAAPAAGTPAYTAGTAPYANDGSMLTYGPGTAPAWSPLPPATALPSTVR